MAVRAPPSLEEVLGNTAPEKLDQPCRDKHLCEIASRITDWPAMAPIMGISKAEEEEIEGKWPRSIERQKIELLRKWKCKRSGKRRQGKKNTYRSLCKVFLKMQRVSLVDEVCDILCDEGSSSDSSDDDSDGSETQMIADGKLEPGNTPLVVDDRSPNPKLLNSKGKPKQSTSSSLPVTESPRASPSDSSSLPDTKSPTHDPLGSLASCLRMSYGSYTPSFAIFQWPPLPTLKVFNLAMIHSHEVVRRKPLDEDLVRLTMRGCIDNIMENKSSVQLDELFESHDGSKVRKVVLIEGAPGAGKSTLAWHICQKWKMQELFHQDFEIVIYVQLGDLEAQSAKEISDLIPMELESDRKDAASAIRGCHGEGVLFVLDGWDEFSAGLRLGSLLGNLVCHPEKLSVQRSTVLITSRPSASAPLQKHATSRIEIVGLMPAEVDRYFMDVFKDPSTVQKLYEHLQERPLIKASCYLPLNAAIVAHLFIELDHALPTTLHGIFSSLVLSCIIRHLTKESEAEPNISSLDELPPDVQEIFLKVCLLAYKGTMRNKVIYSSQDLQSCGLPGNVNALSLLQVVQRFATGKPTSFHFLHISIQELLCALHISKLPSSEQVWIFTKLFNQPRFGAVFQYYAAFTKLRNKDISDFFVRVVRDAVCNRGFESNLLHDCVAGKLMQPLLNVLHCVYEAQDTSHCRLVSSQLKGTLNLSLTMLSPVDLLSLKYFLSCVNSNGTASVDPGISASGDLAVMELNLSDCNLTTADIQYLSLHNLVKMDSSGNSVTCTCAAHLVANSPQLTVLILRRCALSDDGAELFAAALRQHCSLEVLDVSCNGHTTYWTSQILRAIHNHRSLRTLHFEDCDLDMTEVSAALEVNTSLQKLSVSGANSTASDLMILSAALKKNRTLNTLVVLPGALEFSSSSDDGYSNRDIHAFVCSLQDCHLKTLFTIKTVPSQLIDEVNEVRRSLGLPLLLHSLF